MNSLHKYLSATLLALTLFTAVGCGSMWTSTVDDAAITNNVKAALYDNRSLKSSQIDVETSKGVVELSGFVRSPAAATKAVNIAGKVEGVKTVKNRLRTE